MLCALLSAAQQESVLCPDKELAALHLLLPREWLFSSLHPTEASATENGSQVFVLVSGDTGHQDACRALPLWKALQI